MQKLRLRTKFQSLLKREDGQDLIEYALLVGMVALGTTAGLHTVATRMVSAYSSLATTFGTDTAMSQGNQGNQGNQGDQGNQGNQGNHGNQGNQGNHGNHGG